MSTPPPDDYVYFTCVKQGSKIRVRITSKGYIPYANCQFPRDLRQQGKCFRAKTQFVKLVNTRGKYFYSCLKRTAIEEVTLEKETKIIEEKLANLKIFEDKSNDSCVICFEHDKDSVFYPCGHFYCCINCSKKVDKCPICRSEIEKILNKSEIKLD